MSRTNCARCNTGGDKESSASMSNSLRGTSKTFCHSYK